MSAFIIIVSLMSVLAPNTVPALACLFVGLAVAEAVL